MGKIIDRRNEALFALQLRSMKIRAKTEYRFAAISCGGIGPGVRERLREANLSDWRFDFAFPEHLVAVEIEGGAFNYGRHQRPIGFHEDLIKYDAAINLGWTIYRCDGEMIKSGRALNTTLKLIGYSL